MAVGAFKIEDMISAIEQLQAPPQTLLVSPGMRSAIEAASIKMGHVPMRRRVKTAVTGR